MINAKSPKVLACVCVQNAISEFVGSTLNTGDGIYDFQSKRSRIFSWQRVHVSLISLNCSALSTESCHARVVLI